MNTQRAFLFIAIFLTIFILWDKWEITNSVDENGNTITQSQIIGVEPATQATEVPIAADIPAAENLLLEDTTPVVEISNISGEYTTVVTDLLTVQISNKGGTIISVHLNDYPTELSSAILQRVFFMLKVA